jgi:hypothetical protein
MKFPITKIFMGNGFGHGDVVKFSDEYNGILISSPVFITLGKEIKLNKPLSESPEWIDYTQNDSVRGDGGSTSYYKLPENATELGDLIWHKNMNHSIGEAFCALYRLEDNGERKRNLKKVQYYIEQELARC